MSTPTHDEIRRILSAGKFAEAYPAKRYVTAGFQLGEHNGVTWIMYYGGSDGRHNTADVVKKHDEYVRLLTPHFDVERLGTGTGDDQINVRAKDHRKAAAELREKAAQLLAEAAELDARAKS